MSGLDDRLLRLEHELEIFTDRRRRLSIQHEMGVLTDMEFADRAKSVKSQENEVLEAVSDIQRFKTDRPVPPDPEQVRQGLSWIKKVGEMELYLALLGRDPERHKIGEQLADALDFKATILPGDEERFKIEARVNIPLEPITLQDDSSRIMVFTSS